MRKRQTWRVTQAVSLRPVDVLALHYLMNVTSYEYIAPVVRQLIDERMKREIGRDWEAVLQAQQQQEAKEGAVA